MTILFINTGTAPNSGDGDTLRTAFNKINANFGELYYGAINQLVQRDAPPVPASTTTLWYDTVSGRTYVYFDGAWIDASPSNESANQSFLTTASISKYAGYIQSVGLYDSFTGTGSNTVTNITHLNFDTQSAFTVEDMGNGTALIGMNSTFKYINIAGQYGLTAVGLDTLTFVAGTGTHLVTNATPGAQTIAIELVNPVPSTSTAGLLYNDGANNLVWVDPTYNTLHNGSSTFSLNTSGAVVFNNGTVQTTAYVPPVDNNDNYFQALVFLSNTGTLQTHGTVSVNPEMGQLDATSLQIGYTNYTGPVLGLSLITTGTGYIVTGTNIATSGGTGGNLTVNFTAYNGTLTSVTINNPGYNYTAGDVITISHASTVTTTATFVITSVNAPGQQGYVIWPDGTRQTTAYTGTVSYSNVTNIPAPSTWLTSTNVSLLINDIGYLTSSTVKKYATGLNTAGNFVLPGAIIVNYGSTATVTITATSGGGVIASDVSAKPLLVTTFTTNTTYTWQFNPNGSITWPDGSVQASATSATSLAATLTNHINNGLYQLAVLSNGAVQYPDGTLQTTAYTGTGLLSQFATTSSYSNTATYAISATTAVSLLNGQYALRPVAPPVTIVGQPGDKKGDFADDGSNLYVCFEDYVQTNYNVYTVDTATNVYYIDITQIGAPVPQPGWEVHDPIGGPVMTITNVSSGLFGLYNTPYWRLSESTYPNTYYAGLQYILVNPAGTTNVWGKIPYQTAANTSTAVTKLSNFVTPSAPIQLNNVFAEFSGVGNNLRVGAVNSTFTATYSLTTIYGGVQANSSGYNVAFPTTGILLGATSLTPGDRAEVILTVPNAHVAYRIIAMTGATYNTNFISIEQLM